MTISRILVPTDFSPDADAALTYASELAAVVGASVHLLHVVEDPLAAGVWSSEVYTAEIAGLQINLVRDAEQRLGHYEGAATGRLTTEVRTGPAARAIIDVAKDKGIDLIVMGTHGRTGLAHALMGSVAERIVRHASCPVLTLRRPSSVAAETAGRPS
jgi:universal stress protein A